ncbi:DinB family protein [Pedobacter sp.]|uniref:DinB family protein n=1 Tax=Pedobacter sp. TaxID=1411316 RepID=UPI003C69686B
MHELRSKWDNGYKYTSSVISLMDEQQYRLKPSEQEMTFSEQLIHLTDNMLWLSSTYLTTQKPSFKPKEFGGRDKKALTAMADSSFRFVAMVIENFDPEDLEDEIVFGNNKMTKRQIFLLINDHLTHHRAQMIVYLRIAGIAPPKYVGW